MAILYILCSESHIVGNVKRRWFHCSGWVFMNSLYRQGLVWFLRYGMFLWDNGYCILLEEPQLYFLALCYNILYRWPIILFTYKTWLWSLQSCVKFIYTWFFVAIVWVIAAALFNVSSVLHSLWISLFLFSSSQEIFGTSICYLYWLTVFLIINLI